MINTSIKNETPFLSSSTRLNSLIIPTITNTNYINRFAQYNKIKNEYIVKLNDRSSEISFSDYKKIQIEKANYAYEKKLINETNLNKNVQVDKNRALKRGDTPSQQVET